MSASSPPPSIQNNNDYWSRVRENVARTNTLPGLIALPGMGFITGRALGEAMGAPTLLEAALGSQEAGFLTLEFAPAIALAAINFVAVGAVYEAGVLVGSMINQAPLPGGKSVEEALISPTEAGILGLKYYLQDNARTTDF